MEQDQAKGNNLFVLKFDSHKVPEFKEVRNKDWVLYGEHNDYPEYLLNLFNRSAKHNAIVTGKVNYIIGKGWKVNSDGLTTEDHAKVNSLILKANKDETLNDILYKTALDLEIFGGFALEVIRNKAGGIAEIYHIDFSKLRSNSDNSVFYFTREWIKDGKPVSNPAKNEDFREIPSYTKDSKSSKEILYFKQYRPKIEAYPMPDYIGCIPYIEIDYEVANFHLNNIKNGFWGSFLINFLNGKPEPEEQKQIERKMKDKFTGSDNAGRFILNFADGADRAATLESLTPNDLDKLFIELNKQIQQEIFTGHKITNPMLLGIKTEGQLGGRTELLEANELFKNIYVNSRHQIIELVFNKLFGFEKRLEIIPTDPIMSQFSEDVLISIMTDEEKRERAGLPKLEIQKSEKANKVIEAINQLSPLVANKVLESMSQEEIRSLVSLPPSGTTQTFKKQSPIDSFRSRGKSKEDFIVIKSKSTFFNSQQEREESERELLHESFANSLERSIIDLLLKDNTLTNDGLAKALKKSEREIAKVVGKLIEEGNITVKESKTGEVERSVTSDGTDIIDDTPAKTADVFVMYSYEVRKGMGAPIIDTTRDFCRELIELDKFYTRQDIQAISTEVGRDVWETRGGWYHDPKRDVNLPHCRHIWKQNLVKRK